ncbi:TetR/AcrR family transcriptional regulator [Mycolicibacterium sp. YH-1]|uniref:TetR/AcrR family transcriptional regulator n=1 Tax=Mycolicibacterium sp. YH-1 TaxID=2908837 RepID=UPI001F4BD942|nr:TetR/AcrR family transcriptional regulator [Mycolicibacterium sp. YH-1]UNB51284.1 TetR/AcrR family transcriptional regulator [Mycolicibacterium sp. YH-1]
MNVLLEAASQVFSREGMSATTNRIAERAGVSVGTLYQYFPNKETLLHALAERHVIAAGDRLQRVFDQLRAERPPFDETVRTMLATLVDLHSDRPGLHRIMHRLAPRTPSDIEALQALEDRIAEEIAFHLKRCDRGGDDVELTAQTIVATVDAQLHRVMTQHGFTSDDLVTMVMTLAGPPR